MGMTIDKAIEILYERDKCMEYVTDNDSEAFEYAIDTMRKYQKIEEIIAMDDENHRRTIRLADLKEVLEDDNT